MRHPALCQSQFPGTGTERRGPPRRSSGRPPARRCRGGRPRRLLPVRPLPCSALTVQRPWPDLTPRQGKVPPGLRWGECRVRITAETRGTFLVARTAGRGRGLSVAATGDWSGMPGRSCRPVRGPCGADSRTGRGVAGRAVNFPGRGAVPVQLAVALVLGEESAPVHRRRGLCSHSGPGRPKTSLNHRQVLLPLFLNCGRHWHLHAHRKQRRRPGSPD